MVEAVSVSVSARRPSARRRSRQLARAEGACAGASSQTGGRGPSVVEGQETPAITVHVEWPHEVDQHKRRR